MSAVGGVSADYTYDGNKKHVKQVVNPGSGSGTGSKTTYFVYSALTGGLIYKDAFTDGKTTDYAAIGPARVRLENSSGPAIAVYTHADHLGSPVAATDASGNILWREFYHPFGETLGYAAGANDDDAGYTGHVEDAATGLTYMQARYYDPIIGRFLSTDPIDYRDQLNLYAYVANDPVNAFDPTGEFKFKPGDLQKMQRVAQAASKTGLVVAAAPAVALGVVINLAIASPTANPEANIDYDDNLKPSVNLDTNALIALVENPGSEAGLSAKAKIGDRKPLVSEQAASEFLQKGDPTALAGFMADSGATPVSNPSHETTSALMMTGLREADAKVVGAGVEYGARTMTRDQEVLRKAPGLSEEF